MHHGRQFYTLRIHRSNDWIVFCIFQKQHAVSARLIREALKLLRALAGNDVVKNHILKNGAAQQIDDLINLHKVSQCSVSERRRTFHQIYIFHFFSLARAQSSELFARSAMLCISTLTLRSKENSQLLYDVGAAETIVETMKLHPTSKIVQVRVKDENEMK